MFNKTFDWRNELDEGVNASGGLLTKGISVLWKTFVHINAVGSFDHFL